MLRQYISRNIPERHFDALVSKLGTDGGVCDTVIRVYHPPAAYTEFTKCGECDIFHERGSSCPIAEFLSSTFNVTDDTTHPTGIICRTLVPTSPVDVRTIHNAVRFICHKTLFALQVFRLTGYFEIRVNTSTNMVCDRMMVLQLEPSSPRGGAETEIFGIFKEAGLWKHTDGGGAVPHERSGSDPTCVWISGTCTNVGTPKAVGEGVVCYCGPDWTPKVAERVQVQGGTQTPQRGELTACLHVLNNTPPRKPLRIQTNSRYLASYVTANFTHKETAAHIDLLEKLHAAATARDKIEVHVSDMPGRVRKLLLS